MNTPNTQLMQQSSSKRQLGQTLRICQVNVEGMSSSKGEYLSNGLAERNSNVLLAQETHTATREELYARGKIAGFDMIVAEYYRTHIPSTLLAKSYRLSQIVSTDPLSWRLVYRSQQSHPWRAQDGTFGKQIGTITLNSWTLLFDLYRHYHLTTIGFPN